MKFLRQLIALNTQTMTYQFSWSLSESLTFLLGKSTKQTSLFAGVGDSPHPRNPSPWALPQNNVRLVGLAELILNTQSH